MPNWLILLILAVAIATAFAPEWGRSLRRAGATIAAAQQDVAEREGDDA